MTSFELGSILIDRYLLKQKLGDGCYSEVFKAIDLQDNTSVAVKIGYGENGIKQRNVIEAEILELLQEINSDLVIHMKTHYIIDDCVIVVLELIPHTFREVLRNKNLRKIKNISKYAKQMIKFLSLCSSINLIHGDIKPDNILVTKDLRKLKFIDFGLSHCPLVKHKLTKIQTLDYRAPEILLGLSYSSSVDMWSVGCVIMECLIGEPFLNAKNELHLMQMIIEIFGIPIDLKIENSKERDKFFYYNDVYETWMTHGYDEIVMPMGLINFINVFHPQVIIDKECEMLLNLIEGMMQLCPEKRYTPEMCLNHPFFRGST